MRYAPPPNGREGIKATPFHRWVYGLTWEELRDASTVSFPRDTKNVSSVSGNLELDLLREMILLEVPPPTPIHGRAVPRAAARDKCTDGRNPIEQAERNRRKCPRIFQWVKNNSYSRRKAEQYTVFPNRFSQRERYDLACPREQHEADQTMRQKAVFIESPDERTTFLQLRGFTGAASVRRLLRIASRGYFLSSSFKKSTSSPSCARFFRSPWLDPTESWFLLPMYLASRFELALWESFQKKSRAKISFWPASLHTVMSDEEIRFIAAQAMTKELSEEMKSMKAYFLVDSTLWFLLTQNPPRGTSDPSRDRLLEGLVCAPITQPQKQTRLQKVVRKALNQHFLVATERSLMMDSSSEATEKKDNSTGNKASQSGLNGKRRRNTKKRKKKKKKHQIATVSLDKHITVLKDAADERESSEEDEAADEHVPPTIVIAFPDNKTPARDRNRNIVSALSILDGILNDVFQQVGLEPDGDPLAVTEESKVSGVREFDGAGVLQATAPQEKPAGQSVVPAVTAPAPWSQTDEGLKAEAPSVVTFDPQHFGQTVPTVSHRSAFDPFTAYGAFPAGIFNRPDPQNLGVVDPNVDHWWWARGSRTNRDESLLTEFFHRQENSRPTPTGDQVMASSTAASMASSCEGDRSEAHVCAEEGTTDSITFEVTGDSERATVDVANVGVVAEEEREEAEPTKIDPVLKDQGSLTPATPSSEVEMRKLDDRSLSPPSTPSPTLSPILLSLSDLCEMRKDSIEAGAPTDSLKMPSVRSLSSVSALSLSGPTDMDTAKTGVASSGGAVSNASQEKVLSPASEDKPPRKDSKKASPLSTVAVSQRAAIPPSYQNRSRDDHDIKFKASIRRSADVLSSYRNVATRHTSRDDHDIKHIKTAPKNPSYRSVAAKLPTRSFSSSKTGSEAAMGTPLSHLHIDTPLWKAKDSKDACVQSELTADGQDDYQHWADSRQVPPNPDADSSPDARDGSTTITSVLSHKESEDLSTLREERDAYRDMCLTLGAEVAKLKNILASQKSTVYNPTLDFPGTRIHAFDPESMPPVVTSAPRAMTLGAMSEAGYRGDHESQASEDETAKARQFSSAATLPESDASIDHNSGHRVLLPSPGVPLARAPYEPSLQGTSLQSRLAKDIMRFIEATNLQLRKQEPRKRAAIERMTRLVNTMWPRAQVKLYGSNVTGLSLPSSDLDFVIGLPAVHKKAVAVAPGVLEGRNAINETSQKLLARTLKGESWIDPRSIKLIERTAVPVIKVSTKDAKARVLQLDITFDSPGHHGIAALDLVSQKMDELPMIRPLVIVLKQFLGHRGLLTAYTGGISSYCLFLMVARYLQEQASSYGDSGSLLIGFLDFYGNNFDPRSTGISVRNRLYFSRQTGPPVAHAHTATRPQPWRPLGLNSPSTQFFRRNSFSDKGNADAVRGATPALATHPHFQMQFGATTGPQVGPNSFEHSMPYTLDPLLVEDPLNESNNVGRNAFRIFSVLRAFSDAGRALVASLEWDMHSTGEFHEDDNEYPLLKCLLQSEDVVFNDL